MLITNRTDIDVPKDYVRSFEVPDGLVGKALSEAIKEKIRYRWLYLDLNGADLRGADLKCVNLWGADLRHANLQGADFTLAELRDTDLREAKLNRADLWRVDLGYVDLRYAKGVDFSGTRYTRSAKHKRIISIPEIEWCGDPIAAVMPEGDQPLLISIGCKTYTPDEWLAFTNEELEEMDEYAPEWYEAHMEAAIKKSRELEAGFLKLDNIN